MKYKPHENARSIDAASFRAENEPLGKHMSSPLVLLVIALALFFVAVNAIKPMEKSLPGGRTILIVVIFGSLLAIIVWFIIPKP